MNWRVWLKDTLAAEAPLLAKIPLDSHYGAGSLEHAPASKPFLVIRIGELVEDLQEGDEPLVGSQLGTIWVHDEPGSYDLIDEALVLVRTALVGQVSEDNGIACLWAGDSGELADDAMRTIVRNTNYRLVGRMK